MISKLGKHFLLDRSELAVQNFDNFLDIFKAVSNNVEIIGMNTDVGRVELVITKIEQTRPSQSSARQRVVTRGGGITAYRISL